jgi:hypothetical protein
MGDHIGLDFNAGVFAPIWADNSSSLSPANLDLPTFDVATRNFSPLGTPAVLPVLTVTTTAPIVGPIRKTTGGVSGPVASTVTLSGAVALSGAGNSACSRERSCALVSPRCLQMTDRDGHSSIASQRAENPARAS